VKTAAIMQDVYGAMDIASYFLRHFDAANQTDLFSIHAEYYRNSCP
jgi:hypothetical protein